MGGPLNVSYLAVTLEQTWSKLKGISYGELLLLEAVCRTLSILALSLPDILLCQRDKPQTPQKCSRAPTSRN